MATCKAVDDDDSGDLWTATSGAKANVVVVKQQRLHASSSVAIVDDSLVIGAMIVCFMELFA
jgi:hypothetical protein